MQIFHYVTVILEHVDLWEISDDTSRYRLYDGSGAVYNDFDFDPLKLLFPQSTLLKERSSLLSMKRIKKENVPLDTKDEAIIQSSIDHAVINEDTESGILYHDIFYDSSY